MSSASAKTADFLSFVAAVGQPFDLQEKSKMAIQIDKHELRTTARPIAADAAPATDPGNSPEPSLLTPRSTNAAAAGVDYAKMAAKLIASGRDPSTLNALGVCYMRLGNVAEAVRIYRGLALQPGCIWERAGIPIVYKRNFATALLLAGLPSGCLSVLHALDEPEQPRTRELLTAIKTWERSLPFFQRWD